MNDHKQNPQSTPRTTSRIEALRQTAQDAPKQSGVYIWRDERHTVIYVGKAKNLKNRLSSYFSGSKDLKTRLLVSNAASIEYTTTSNEYEAFLLENNLIKKFSPRYNISLKDGKSYPVIKITNEKYPRVFKTRNIVRDGSLYFGPFPDVEAVESVLEILAEIYPIRKCKRFHERKSACVYHHIGRCLAPCKKQIDESSYAGFIGEIKDLLEGGGKQTEAKITTQMKEAAASLNFEKAARFRDALKSLDILRKKNAVQSFEESDKDFVASWREGETAGFTVLKLRGGKLLGRDSFTATSLSSDEDLIVQFMASYYREETMIPPEILTTQADGFEFMKRFLFETYGIEPRITEVTESSSAFQKAVIAMARQNAKEDVIRKRREGGDFHAMEELQTVLDLSVLPVRIEGFDIAHIAGKFPVASLVSFFNGNPDKKNYRYFRLKTTDGIIDDFASIREAVSRRYSRLINEGSELPDLVLIDGGIGQVNSAQSVLTSLGLDIPVAGLAKRDEEIYLPGNSTPIRLEKRSDALRLLQRVRDETHRFATSKNQALRTKENTVSPFTQITGVGEKRAALLSVKFKTMKALASSREEEVCRALKVNTDMARQILTCAKRLEQAQESEQHKVVAAGDVRYQITELASQALEIASPKS